ncbi:MAG: ABC transporter substrate-binding protein [Gammaproteobacteria bacterium]|nr:ABC transporter substrate-binding protein [Gammaproteobacteria bacterium]
MTRLILIFHLIVTSTAYVSASEIPTDSWPVSWSEPAKTASELNLTVFRQAPSLKARVESGELPPLAKRLPNDPVVLEPFDRIGQYGGTARVFHSDSLWSINSTEPFMTIDAAAGQILPNVVKRWEYSDDSKVLTMYLRRGVKWSDGSDLTADDFVFLHQHMMLNKEITPVPYPPWRDMKSIKLDDYSFRFEFEKPSPLFINTLGQLSDFFIIPSRFMRQFHADFTDREKLIERAREAGYISWMAYFNSILRWQRNDPPLAPTISAYQLTHKTPTTEYYVRNPYYWKVDTEGNQLPYIDAVRADIIESAEVMAAKAATGQVDFAGFPTRTQDFPLYKLGEKSAGITTLQWSRMTGSDIVIMPNFTIEDDRLRKLYWDSRFRKALSLAINRDEMNNIIYFGRGVPRQVTVNPSSVYFEPEFARAYADYHPERARELLTDMGVVDLDGDGLRNYPDGDELVLTVEFLDSEGPKAISMELVIAYWREVGLDMRLKLVDPALQQSRATGNLMQMTVWHADRTSDILFPIEPFWFVPMHLGWEEAHWNLWVTWFRSDGEEGEQPPDEIIQLREWWDEMILTPNPARRIELGKNILRSNAENLWSIGTVGLGPQPIVVSKRLKNVPTQGYWGWDNRFAMTYHPATWYLEQ